MATKPHAPPAPKALTKKQSPRATIPSAIALSIGSGLIPGADRIVTFGTGKIGKSTLAAFLPAPLFLDIEAGTKKLNVAFDLELREDPNWLMLRGKLASIASDPPEGIRSIVLDTATIAEELAKEHVIATRKTEKGKVVDSIEGFGWGKGWQYVYDEFNGLLADLDRIVAKGIHVCLIAHEVSSPVPNPAGEDFIRWEPLLYSGDKKGRGSIRARLKNWAEHIIFITYDVEVEEGKGRGSGTRTLYTQELPTHIAGSRTKQIVMSFDLQHPDAIWRELGIV
jgi:hypothetical protein